MAIPGRPLGLAFVGLGSYVSKQLAPALAACRHIRLAGAVSSERDKAQDFLREHGGPVDAAYTYDDFAAIAADDRIDVLYIVTPNAQHEEYVVKAAQAGKHVICEKPLGVTPDECQRMMDACQIAGVRFSVGYRMHFEPLTMHLIRLLRSGQYGDIQRIEAAFSSNSKQAGEWRLNSRESGGGPLMDMGIYALSAACYVVGTDPVAVSAVEGAKTDLERFGDPEVEQRISWEMHFPGDISAMCRTSYADTEDFLRVYTSAGVFTMEPSYDYQAQKLFLPDGNEVPRPDGMEQTFQMDDFARCIQENRPTRVPGRMGLRDVLIMQTIYQAAETGQRLTIPYPADWEPIGERILTQDELPLTRDPLDETIDPDMRLAA